MDILQLKERGHRLLDEYIDLGVKYRMHGTRKQEMEHAYRKLGMKLDSNPHFSSMKDSQQVMRAVLKLQRMIKMRHKKIRYRGLDKNVIAPNVKELQKGVH